jgi:DNA-binding IclR family transcriptional regulator
MMRAQARSVNAARESPHAMPRKPLAESVADAHAAPGGVAAVDRALTLLRAFRPGDASLTLAELAQRTLLYKSTALRLLASLEHAGLLRRLDGGRYALGPEIARLHGVHGAAFSAGEAVLPVLRKLVAATGESAAWHVRRGDSRVCLLRVDSPHPVRDHIRAGDVLPLDRGTGGRVLTAFDPSFKPPGVKDRRLAALIREQGYFAAQGDRLAEVAGISAPVFAAGGQLAGALTLTMPVHRYDARYVRPVLEAARGLTAQLGG